MNLVQPDRFNAPSIRIPSRLPELSMAADYVANSIPCYTIEGGAQDIVKIELVFKAGTVYESKPLLASTCNSLLKEGTQNSDSETIAATVDFYGAQLFTEVTKDRASVSLLTMTKYLNNLLPLFSEICCLPAFRENELDIYARKSRSSLEVNLEKVEFICRIAFSKLIFGKHAYCDNFTPADYGSLRVEDLQEFFRKHYNLKDAFFIVSGKDTSFVLSRLSDAFGKYLTYDTSRSDLGTSISWSYQRGQSFIQKPGALQSAIRVGLPAPQRSSDDYAAFYLAHTALGGYFGSRLMQNIREEKGYTYGIGSAINTLEKGSYLVISTQVGAPHTMETLKEITNELNRLRSEPIHSDELDLIKNYVSGTLLQSMDGPFELGEKLKSSLLYNLPEGYYAKFLKAIFATTAEDVMNAALKYLDPSNMSEAVVGSYE